jgi:hypothetical protein
MHTRIVGHTRIFGAIVEVVALVVRVAAVWHSLETGVRRGVTELALAALVVRGAAARELEA